MPVRWAALVALCALVVAAGCAGVSGPATPTTPTPAEPTATPLPGVTPAPYAAALRIENPSRQSVTVEASAQFADGAPTTATDTLVVNRTTDERRIDLDDRFDPRTDYRVVVAVDGTTRWNETVYDYESYTLTVSQNGSVRVADLAVR